VKLPSPPKHDTASDSALAPAQHIEHPGFQDPIRPALSKRGLGDKRSPSGFAPESSTFTPTEGRAFSPSDTTSDSGSAAEFEIGAETRAPISAFPWRGSPHAADLGAALPSRGEAAGEVAEYAMSFARCAAEAPHAMGFREKPGCIDFGHLMPEIPFEIGELPHAEFRGQGGLAECECKCECTFLGFPWEAAGHGPDGPGPDGPDDVLISLVRQFFGWLDDLDLPLFGGMESAESLVRPPETPLPDQDSIDGETTVLVAPQRAAPTRTAIEHRVPEPDPEFILEPVEGERGAHPSPFGAGQDGDIAALHGGELEDLWRTPGREMETIEARDRRESR